MGDKGTACFNTLVNKLIGIEVQLEEIKSL